MRFIPTIHPIIHLYCLCWNESALIPFFLRHYDALISSFYIWDNQSVDNSLALLRDDPRVTVTPFTVSGDSFVLEEKRLSETIWQASRGAADWVAVVDMDEFLYHPDLLAFLRVCDEKGVTAIRAIGYDMVSNSLPTNGLLTDQITSGVRSPGHDKLCLFKPDALTATNFGLGRHTATPAGRVVWPACSEVSMLHYKHLGPDYHRTRNRMLSGGLREQDLAMGWGRHYLRPDEQVDADFARLQAAAAPVPGLKGGAPAGLVARQEMAIRQSGRFDAQWYLSEYPDVAAALFDPIAHFNHYGWREGRRPNPDFDLIRDGGTDGKLVGREDPAAFNPFLSYFIPTGLESDSSKRVKPGTSRKKAFDHKDTKNTKLSRRRTRQDWNAS